jgi:hypothetical protein
LLLLRGGTRKVRHKRRKFDAEQNGQQEPGPNVEPAFGVRHVWGCSSHDVDYDDGWLGTRDPDDVWLRSLRKLERHAAQVVRGGRCCCEDEDVAASVVPVEL